MKPLAGTKSPAKGIGRTSLSLSITPSETRLLYQHSRTLTDGELLSVVIAGLDPAIHPTKKMDARVKPAHDESNIAQFGITAILFGRRSAGMASRFRKNVSKGRDI